MACENATVIAIFLLGCVLRTGCTVSMMQGQSTQFAITFGARSLQSAKSKGCFFLSLCSASRYDRNCYIGDRECFNRGNARKTNPENNLLRHAHAVVGLNSLSTEVNCRGRPMCIAVVHWDEDDIFREYINLESYISILRPCVTQKS